MLAFEPHRDELWRGCVASGRSPRARLSFWLFLLAGLLTSLAYAVWDQSAGRGATRIGGVPVLPAAGLVLLIAFGVGECAYLGVAMALIDLFA